MTNIKLLDDTIIESGLKKSYIAEQIGCDRTTFYKKCKGKTEFTANEIVVITNLSNIFKERRDAIFLS